MLYLLMDFKLKKHNTKYGYCSNNHNFTRLIRVNKVKSLMQTNDRRYCH